MIESPILGILFLLCSSLLTGVISSIQRLGRAEAEEIAKQQKGVAKWLIAKKRRDELSFAMTLSKGFFLIAYTLSAFIYCFKYFPETLSARHIVTAGLIILLVAFFTDFLFRMISLFKPHGFFKATCFIASCLIIIIWPLSTLFFKCLKWLFPSTEEATSFRMKDKILEILHDSEFAPYLDTNDQKLILSVITFKERIAREVLVPRIDMVTLDAQTTVEEAGRHFMQEGYSRIPVYKENVDNIIGTLYYKDLLNLFFSKSPSKQILNQPIEKFLKPIMYTPETKKISHLLQEFRGKQIHMAIVVDEYGGTEGIVTIEDILEELVGEIADEYDLDEEALFIPLPSGGWIVDAKMSIIDIEEELGIQIPQSPEYDTIGGFIFHKAGTIPAKQWRLHQDEFDIEVLSSSERAIEKIRISPHK